MPFQGRRPNGLRPLRLTKNIGEYFQIYNEKHNLFCQRFIDTILTYHMDFFMNNMVSLGVNSELLGWGLWDTDMFLWKIRDFLDTCMDDLDKPVISLMRDELLLIALEDFFSEMELDIQNYNL